ncbi:MAG: hypothetical protein CL912_15090 [Deltaproteobacteria bacterium]|nr:hypothetical protein [Deltaproteobacteria bacterium]
MQDLVIIWDVVCADDSSIETNAVCEIEDLLWRGRIFGRDNEVWLEGFRDNGFVRSREEMATTRQPIALAN